MPGRKVLVASSDPFTRRELSWVMGRCELDTLYSSSIAGSRAILDREPVELVVCSPELPDGRYGDLLRLLKNSGCSAPVVVASDFQALEEYREYLKAMRLGAFDFLCAPYRRPAMVQVVEGALREAARCAAERAAAA